MTHPIQLVHLSVFLLFLWGKTISLNYQGSEIIIILKDYKYIVIKVQSDLKKDIWPSFMYFFSQNLLATYCRSSTTEGAIDSEIPIRVCLLDLASVSPKSRTLVL